MEKEKKTRVAQMLDAFAKSYVEKTEDVLDLEFGCLIDDEWYSVSLWKDHTFRVAPIKPVESTFYIETSLDILTKIHDGKMAAMTAGGKADMKDYAPLELRFMEGASFPKSFDLMDFIFHFFIIGKPEKLLFGKEYSRIVHGGYAIPFIYNDGLRTAWYRVDKGMIINADEKDQSNPFDTLVIGIKGTGVAKLDDVEHTFGEGITYLIPKQMRHSFYTTSEEGLEFIIVMFGEGA